MTIPQLQLAPAARDAAIKLQAAFPDVVFTSGRRSIEKQAQMMSRNMVKAPEGPLKWLTNTYIYSDPLYHVLNDGSVNLASQVGIEAKLLDTMLAMDTINLLRISRHLTGDAFDIDPITDNMGVPTAYGQRVIDYVRRNIPEAKMLLREGGLIVWHVQLPPSVEV